MLTCGGAVTAPLVAFAASLIGKSIPIYDVSTISMNTTQELLSTHLFHMYCTYIPSYLRIWMCVHVPSHCLRDPGQSGSRKLPVIPNTLGSEERI